MYIYIHTCMSVCECVLSRISELFPPPHQTPHWCTNSNVYNVICALIFFCRLCVYPSVSILCLCLCLCLCPCPCLSLSLSLVPEPVPVPVPVSICAGRCIHSNWDHSTAKGICVRKKERLCLCVYVGVHMLHLFACVLMCFLVCVCVWVYRFARKHARAYDSMCVHALGVCMCTHACARARVRVFACVCECVCVHVHVCVRACVRVCCVCMCVWSCVCVDIL